MSASERKSYDAVVVGAGVIGLACAWRAALRGMSVLCVDRGPAGGGTSRVAAGMLAPVTETDFGEEELLRLNVEGAAAWPAFREELEDATGVGTLHRASGALEVAADRDELEQVRRRLELQRSLGLDVEWLTGRECRELEPGLSPRVGGGIHAPADGHVDPRAVAAALTAALEGAGGELVVGAGASLETRDGRVAGVEVEGRGAVAAGDVVLAAGSATPNLVGLDPHALPPVRPVKGQILRLRHRAGAAPLAERIVRSPRCYVVCRADGEVVLGATTEERGDLEVTAGGVFGMLEAARELLPDIDELEWVEASAGLRPATPDNAPVIGRGEVEGLLWATGHYRHGVLLAPLTGNAIAALLADENPGARLAPFSPARFVAGADAAADGAPTAASVESGALAATTPG